MKFSKPLRFLLWLILYPMGLIVFVCVAMLVCGGEPRFLIPEFTKSEAVRKQEAVHRVLNAPENPDAHWALARIWSAEGNRSEAIHQAMIAQHLSSECSYQEREAQEKPVMPSDLFGPALN